MTKKKCPASIDLIGTERPADGGDWTLTILLEQRGARTGWVARDSAWPMASQMVVETLNRLPPNARVYLDCRLPDSMTPGERCPGVPTGDIRAGWNVK
jgi:hypothetical protein